MASKETFISCAHVKNNNQDISLKEIFKTGLQHKLTLFEGGLNVGSRKNCGENRRNALCCLCPDH
jgi:hypothetical protein